jgi:hypothetical protein
LNKNKVFLRFADLVNRTINENILGFAEASRYFWLSLNQSILELSTDFDGKYRQKWPKKRLNRF